MNKYIKISAAIVISFVVGSLLTFSIIKWTPLFTDTLGTKVITKNGKTVVQTGSLKDSTEKARDAVVMVQCYKNDTVASTGTGFVYKVDDKYGYILTNQHVVEEMEKIELILSNDDKIDGTLLGSDPYLDLAVIRIDKSKVLGVATLGTSTKMNVGDIVFTIGSPLGYDYRGSVTSGILSGKDRMVSVSVSGSTSSDWIMKVIQTDAAINPGNSGGPLLNVNGEVIGINSMKLVQEQIEGMGFAIPIEYAMSHVDSLENGKKIEWPVLGINMVNVNESSQMYKNNLKVDNSITYGVIVAKIVENTGASKSGLQEGDVVIALNGEKVKDTAHLRYELYKCKVGDTIVVTYIRGTKEDKAKITLTTDKK